MSIKHVHSDLIKAWADGAEIQYCVPGRGVWYDAPNPEWMTVVKYRIKPKPVEVPQHLVYNPTTKEAQWVDSSRPMPSGFRILRVIGETLDLFENPVWATRTITREEPSGKETENVV